MCAVLATYLLWLGAKIDSLTSKTFILLFPGAKSVGAVQRRLRRMSIIGIMRIRRNISGRFWGLVIISTAQINFATSRRLEQ